jgi:hypothetical protein
MPLTLTLTEGVLPQGSEPQAVARITEAFLKHHGLAGNKAMTPNVTAQVHVLPRSSTFSGGKEFAGAWIEWKVPSFALVDRKVQQDFFAEATQIIHDLSGGRQPKNQIYSNALHTVDGSWNWEGKALTNSELGAAISKG